MMSNYLCKGNFLTLLMSPQTRKTDNFLPPRSSYTNKYETISIWKQKVLFLHRLPPDNFLVFLRPHSWIWPYLTFTVVQLNSWVDKKIGWQTNVFSFLYINAFFSSETQKMGWINVTLCENKQTHFASLSSDQARSYPRP